MKDTADGSCDSDPTGDIVRTGTAIGLVVLLLVIVGAIAVQLWQAS